MSNHVWNNLCLAEIRRERQKRTAASTVLWLHYQYLPFITLTNSMPLMTQWWGPLSRPQWLPLYKSFTWIFFYRNHTDWNLCQSYPHLSSFIIIYHHLSSFIHMSIFWSVLVKANSPCKPGMIPSCWCQCPARMLWASSGTVEKRWPTGHLGSKDIAISPDLVQQKRSWKTPEHFGRSFWPRHPFPGRWV